MFYVGREADSEHETDEDKVKINCSSDEFGDDYPPSREKLERDLCNTQTRAYAAGTLCNLACIWHIFRRFTCLYMIFDWPVKTHTICLFAQYLMYTFRSAKSVKNYVCWGASR